LNHLSDKLDESQKQELRTGLEQQTRRMAGLVEQLLDLSRLDADAVVVRRQSLDLEMHLRELVTVAAGERASEVEVEVRDHENAIVDRTSSITSSPTSSRTRSGTAARL